MDPDTQRQVWDIVKNGADSFSLLVLFIFLVHRGFLYLKREYLREVKRADEAEARADKYEDLLLKSRNVVSGAVHSHEEIVDDLVELTKRHGGAL